MSDSLFKEFEPVSAKQWKQKIQADLKGADYDQALIWHTLEGIDVRPFYHGEDLPQKPGPIPGHPNSWEVVQRVYVDDPVVANQLIIKAIDKGAEAVWLSAKKDFEPANVLAQFPFDTTTIYFELSGFSAKWLKDLVNWLNTKQANYFLRIDPLGKLVSTGNWYDNHEADHRNLRELVALSPSRVVGVELGHFQNAGAGVIQQLAYGMCQAHTYMDYLKDQELKLCFTVAVGSNYFFEIAKIRALRWLYASLAEAMEMPADCHVLAEPSARNKSIYDYNTNMLRTTTECMSAVLGGADAVSNRPYDSLYHRSNEFGERIARNQLLVLKAESYFDTVDNPSDGSYYIECLTQQLAERALELFKQLNANGGMLSHLKSGLIQRKVKESAQREQVLFDEGKLVMIGTNVFPNTEDRMKDELELYPFVKTRKQKTEIEPLIAKRLAEKIEKERLADEN
jgi:methylmalonyl-CoA mutase